jgi:thioredoxin reductase (NADPH)
LASHAKQVYLIHRGPELRANPTYQEQIAQENNIEVIYNTNVLEILGQESLEKVRLDKEFQGSPDLALNGLFIEIGSVPNVKMLQVLEVETNKQGYVKTKADQSTNISGFYAAGDITTNSNGFRQIVTAAAEGAVAIEAIFKWLKG